MRAKIQASVTEGFQTARQLRALNESTPESVRRFFNLAGWHIRRELIDLSRHFFGPPGAGANSKTPAARPSEVETPAPSQSESTGITDYHVADPVGCDSPALGHARKSLGAQCYLLRTPPAPVIFTSEISSKYTIDYCPWKITLEFGPNDTDPAPD